MEILEGTQAPPMSMGDPEAFMVQFWHHAPAVHAYLARRTGRQGADDLFGEVWLRAYRARATYDNRSPDPRPWLYGIARNTLRAHWHREAQPWHPLREVASDPWEDADGRLDAVGRTSELRTALTHLSDGEREVLLLVAWERLSPTEAAAVLGIPPGTARSRLHRARRLLQGELAPMAPVPDIPTVKESHR